MLKCLLARVSQIGITTHEVSDEVLCCNKTILVTLDIFTGGTVNGEGQTLTRLGDLIPVGSIELVLSLDDLCEEIRIILVVERGISENVKIPH